MSVRRINRVLAVVLLAVLFGIGGATIASRFGSLGYAFFVTYTQYVDEEATGARGLVNRVEARIKSFGNALNTYIAGKDVFRKWNARFQMALGKEVLNFGGTTMVRLKTGQLYDLETDADVSQDVARMGKVRAMLEEKGVPMLFVYAHSTLYRDDMLPEGVTDGNNEVADRIVSGLRGEGIDTLDSREILAAEALDDIVFRTDWHWTPYAAFRVFSTALEEINRLTGLGLDETAAQEERFDMEWLPATHVGDLGVRVGVENIGADRFPMITPRFETQIHQRISGAKGVFTERDGDFAQAVLNLDVLEENRGVGNVYDTYGYHSEVTYYDNPDAPPVRVLVVKDSFGTPFASFMSLSAAHVCALDLRKGRGTIEEYVESFQPDVVVIVHCQEMFRGRNYVFVD